MATDLEKFSVRPGHTLREVMQAISDNWREVALVVDAGRVVGVITDGDIRRGLLAGLTLDSAAREIMTPSYVSVGPEADRASVIDLMRARGIRHVPVVDAGHRLLGIHFLEALLGTAERPNAAVIMAGGEGRRLRPLTHKVPKPMVPVAGRPILERIVLHLVGYGVRQIYISVNYLADAIIHHFEDGSRFGCNIEYLRENEALGTGGPLSLLPSPIEDPLIVMNGDLVTQLDIARLLHFHAQRGARATIVARHYQVEIPFGVIDHRDYRLIDLIEKPAPEYLINAGIYVIDPGVLPLVPTGTHYPITALFQALLARGDPVAVYPIEEDWIDVGRREELDRARGDKPD